MAPPPNPVPGAALPRRAFQWDLARQVERLDWLVAQLPRYAQWGYQELYLHLEDAVEYPSLPGIARRDAYSHAQLGRLVDAASRAGLGVVPIVNLLGHTQYLLNDPALRDLNELRAPDGSPLARGQVCPLHPRLPEVAEKLLRDVAPFCTAGQVHVGLDESYHLGRHPLSRAEIAAAGLAAHFAGHVGRLHALAGRLRLRLGMWADMLALLPAAIPLLPPGLVAYDWYYYPFRRLPALELRNFAPYDLAAPLRARGIEYWGCPMDGAFRHEPLPVFADRLANIVAWWRRCRRTAAAGLLLTAWEPGRIAAELAMTVDAAAAGLWLDGEEDPGRLLAGGCRRMFGRKGAGAARALAGVDRYPFSGYVRWRINDRWAGAATDLSLAPWRAELRACGALEGRRELPVPVRASLRLRAYLAARDLLVRAAGQGVWRLRAARARGRAAAGRRLAAALDLAARDFAREIAAGRTAARAMWRRTRDRRVVGPNEDMVRRDAEQLRAWRAWLRREQGSDLFRASPVVGAWQLLVTVDNFAPAAQRVVVERRGAGGEWEEVDGVFTIEFQARAARRRAELSHRVSVPLDGPVPGAGRPWLRIAVRGFGRVRLRDVRLTDGVRDFAPAAGARSRAVIGRDAPASGYPDFDWAKNRGVWVLALAREA